MTQIQAADHNATLRHAAEASRVDRRERPGLFTRIAERWERYSGDERNPDNGSFDVERRLHRAGY
jgi:hypothetical protein